jgi:hypothetical protein
MLIYRSSCMSSSRRDYISMLRISAHSSVLCLRFIGRVCPYAAPPRLSFLLLPRLSYQLLPHLPNYRLWMCSSDQRITTPPSLCGRPPVSSVPPDCRSCWLRWDRAFDPLML